MARPTTNICHSQPQPQELDEGTLRILRHEFHQARLLVCPGDFHIDDYNRTTINQLFHYFMHSKECQFSLQKGVMILGKVGCGKTTLMQVFRRFIVAIRNTNRCQPITPSMLSSAFGIKTANSIAMHYEKEGSLDAFLGIGYLSKQHVKICIDDLGREPAYSLYMGNRRNVIEALLFERYRLFKEKGVITHATTNLDPSQLLEVYGEATFDRMREMFNFVHLKGDTRRK